jgi:GT2 family glycosyltransferase
VKDRAASSAFIIATRNRPEELLQTVRSLIAQTTLPAELCIVDASDETPTRDQIETLCEEAGVPLDHHRPAESGLTVQRNVGIDRTKADPVFFIDDDVVLDPDCHEEILKEYEKWGPELGGVRAAPTRPARPGKVSLLLRKMFGFGGWWPEASGRMRSGFYVEGVSESAGVRRLEYFTGWFMSFRREVVERERFDEKLSGYGHKEDIDYTYRVSRDWILLQTPKARCDHLRVHTARLSAHELQRMNLSNQFYLHRKNMPQTLRHRAALWWALFGLFLFNVGKSVRRKDVGYMTGLMVGAVEQARGRGLVDPAREALGR